MRVVQRTRADVARVRARAAERRDLGRGVGPRVDDEISGHGRGGGVRGARARGAIGRRRGVRERIRRRDRERRDVTRRGRVRRRDADRTRGSGFTTGGVFDVKREVLG